MKLDKYDDYENFFKDYLKNPNESNYRLRDTKVQNIGRENQRQRNFWDLILKHAKILNKSENEIIPKFLEEMCNKHRGNLTHYTSYFDESYIENFEHRYKVFNADEGLINMPNTIS